MDNDEEAKRYRMQQLADLGSLRRDGISTVDEDDQKGHRRGYQPEAPRPPRRPQGQADHKALLNDWSNLHSTVGDVEEELDSLMGGQSHRARLNNEVLHSYVGPPSQQHRNSRPGRPPPRMGYRPVYNNARPPPNSRPSPTSRPAPAVRSSADTRSPIHKSSQASKPSPVSRSSPAPKPAPAVTKPPTPKPSQAAKRSPTPKPLSTFKQPPAPAPQPNTSPRRKVELTGYNLPQPQTSRTASQTKRHSEEDLLTFDSPPSVSSRKSPVKVYQSASMSDLMEIDDEEMLSNQLAKTGLQASKFASSPPTHATTKPKASTENPQRSGLMASKYAIDDSVTEDSASKAKAKGANVTKSNDIDFWQKPLPRAVKDIITKGKAEPSPAEKDSNPLAKSRWAN